MSTSIKYSMKVTLGDKCKIFVSAYRRNLYNKILSAYSDNDIASMRMDMGIEGCGFPIHNVTINELDYISRPQHGRKTRNN